MREPDSSDWHALTSDSLQQLHSSDAGLTSAQATERLQGTWPQPAAAARAG